MRKFSYNNLTDAVSGFYIITVPQTTQTNRPHIFYNPPVPIQKSPCRIVSQIVELVPAIQKFLYKQFKIINLF